MAKVAKQSKCRRVERKLERERAPCFLVEGGGRENEKELRRSQFRTIVWATIVIAACNRLLDNVARANLDKQAILLTLSDLLTGAQSSIRPKAGDMLTES